MGSLAVLAIDGGSLGSGLLAGRPLGSCFRTIFFAFLFHQRLIARRTPGEDEANDDSDGQNCRNEDDMGAGHA